MSIRYQPPKTALQIAQEYLKALKAERRDWMEPHPFGPRYEAAIFAAKREAHLAQLDPAIAEAKAEVARLKVEAQA
jgi:hypothetical protein